MKLLDVTLYFYTSSRLKLASPSVHHIKDAITHQYTIAFPCVVWPLLLFVWVPAWCLWHILVWYGAQRDMIMYYDTCALAKTTTAMVQILVGIGHKPGNCDLTTRQVQEVRQNFPPVSVCEAKELWPHNSAGVRGLANLLSCKCVCGFAINVPQPEELNRHSI